MMKIESTLFSAIPKDAADILNNFDEIIQHTLPLNSRQLCQLPENIRKLSHQLTDERTARRVGYMNEAAALSAYIRYFMWWNLVRLTPLFAGFASSGSITADKDAALPSSPAGDASARLHDGDFCLDCGSGPLTVPIAMWLGCPELRKKKLTWYCLDLSQTALSQGEDLYTAVAARTAATTPDQQLWQIIRVKGAVGTEIKKKAAFISCANMFNELFWNAEAPLEQLVKKYSNQLLSYATPDAALLLVEPGVPRAARFVSLFRDFLLRKGFSVLAPCPHTGTCPMDGRKGGKWCHFVLETDNAPARLKKLSAAAGIPKDRASLSFVYAVRSEVTETSPEAAATGNQVLKASPALSEKAAAKSGKTGKSAASPATSIMQLRIVSDAISLYNKTIGRYSCSEMGLSLAIAPENALMSGDIVSVDRGTLSKKPDIDRKSGAVKIKLA